MFIKCQVWRTGKQTACPRSPLFPLRLRDFNGPSGKQYIHCDEHIPGVIVLSKMRGVRIEMKQEKLESILETAKKMFARYGLQKTNMDEIARMARVAKAAIYNYFGSKDRVYMEVLRQEMDEIVEKMSSSVDQEISPSDKLIDFARVKFRHMRGAINILNPVREGIEKLLPS